MRALLLVNPKATSTNLRTRDVLIRALGAAVDLEVAETGYRGHASLLSATAKEKGFDAVAVLGGDGTVNEVANGLMAVDDRAKMIIIPGGSANVLARALGLPNDPIEATGAVLEALREGRSRTISLGLAEWDVRDSGTGAGVESRYFTFCADLGWDAEVIRAVEGLRSAGYRASPTLYMQTALRHYLMTDRRHPSMTLTRPGQADEPGIFLAIVSNTAPWTFVGNRPVNPTPWAGFDTGLDVLAMTKLRLPAVMSLLRQIVGEPRGLPTGKHLVQAHDESVFTLESIRPIALQLDGDYLGERERVTFRSIPDALQVLV